MIVGEQLLATATAAIKIGRYSYEKRSRDVLELQKLNGMTFWHQLTSRDDDDDDGESTSSVRRLIDVIVTSERRHSERNLGFAQQRQLPRCNGVHDKPTELQVVRTSVLLLRAPTYARGE